ncbi:MAG: Glutathione transport system permease protein GsiD [Anaerolineales bacterium]|nr:Glutathione transport system permease protein GsiD [Anaerolineales bacterium]
MTVEVRETRRRQRIDTDEQPKGESLRRRSIRALLRHRSGMVGLVITLVLLVLALLAPAIAPYDELTMHAADRFHSPSATYLLGTDEFGRDILSRILIGARISFSVGFISVSIATALGVPIGLIAGYAGGWFDGVTMRFFDALLAFPAILLAIVIMAILGPGPFPAIMAIAIVNIPTFARLTRGNVFAEKEKDYVEAARAVGVRPRRIIFRTILPNVVSTQLVHMTVSAAAAILLEAALSYLGLGIPPPAPSWGSMVSIGQDYLRQAPWYGIFPGLAITSLVMGLYLLGDGLRDALDPRRQRLI